MPIRAVLIDLDGTLLDTVPDLADAANAMLAELGRLTLPQDTIRDFVGKGIPNLVGRCLGYPGESDAPEAREALALFKRHYAAVNGRKTRIYPGVPEGLRALRAAGLKTACVTNKAGAFTEQLLAATGLDRLLDLTVSGDTLAEKKPHPLPFLHLCERFGIAPAEALVVGDSRNDVAGARAAGCPVFCVPYGYSEGEDVRDLGADAIVGTLEEAASRLLSLKTEA
ncbi:MAG: phosphoglycolate phosphatase [Burkholderiales bacterium]|uniref:Phosphoglycolate phosphatase n=1 Tax=Candidatus Desulfobacillus denitrificans TaxID=2608985 RepID=A0A809S928_9PROT|nr:phosphoglycolate phosphatase [Burkholderiales bacterium]BBO19974.1 phosphoglycolate phosphatase [Candidatus Desulfobacillus denitrificans]GIK46341.1 MAG: phosphoglycolate phosphatase, bacterial [Betaproteobacteria bacterium]GJQ56470.1 MAG: phosphoglycolate phosphatase, bacterial [Rhodocyclaceae bacterium]MCZ2420799.1 phosphoglycolate phosphatase [Burkholderiales bacterium]